MKKFGKNDHTLLASGCYIAHSEIFKDLKLESKEDVDMKKVEEEETKRIVQIVGMNTKDEFVKRMVKLNLFSQQYDVGGWRTKENGLPAKQKLHKKDDGDFYICPYCNASRFPAEVECQSGYRYGNYIFYFSEKCL